MCTHLGAEVTGFDAWLLDSTTNERALLFSTDTWREPRMTARTWEQSGFTVRMVRGRKMRSAGALFDEFAAAFQFPLYFGENWAAFDDCMTDLDWLPRDVGWVVVFDHPADVLSLEPESLRTLVKVLMAVGEGWRDPVARGDPWGEPNVPFHVVLAGDTAELAAAKRLWGAAGMQFLGET